MGESRVYLAIDLGASSGRVLAGKFDGSRLALEEVHRFHNGPYEFGAHLHWNVLELWKQIQDGLRAAAAKYGNNIRSVGVDTWGVDFALLGTNDELLGNPFATGIQCFRARSNKRLNAYRETRFLPKLACSSWTSTLCFSCSSCSNWAHLHWHMPKRC